MRVGIYQGLTWRRMLPIVALVGVALTADSPGWAAPAHRGDAVPAVGAAPSVEEGTTPEGTVTKAEVRKQPWRGSAFTYGNAFTLISLDQSYQLTYNPIYYMSFRFLPQWWFSDVWYVRAILAVNREFTEHDETTFQNEAWLEDLVLVGGGHRIYTIPKAKIDLSAGVSLIFPTSKASQAASLIMSIGFQGEISRTFKVLKGLTIGGRLRATPNIHRYTTRQRESPLVSGCSPSEGNCGSFLNMGLRNAKVRLTTGVNFSLAFLDWMGFAMEIGWLVDWLHPASGGEDQISYVPQEPQDRRYYSYFQASLFFMATKALGISLDWMTLGPQLAPDSSYYNPLFNRFTTLSLNLTLKVDGFIALLGGK